MFKLFAILLVVILLGVPSFLYNSYYKVVIKPKKDAEAHKKSTPDAGPAITSDSENVEPRPSVHKKTEKKYERYLGV